MSYLFFGCEHLKNLDLSSFDFKMVKNIEYIFSSCENLNNIIDNKNFNIIKSLKQIDNYYNKIEILPSDFAQYDLSFKLIILGEADAGKSKLIQAGTRNIFEDLYKETVGVEFASFNLKYQNKIIKLQIWDTCGQEVYRSLIEIFYKNTSLVILIYAINDIYSFKEIENWWIKEVRAQCSPDVKLFLVGNKIDIPETE